MTFKRFFLFGTLLWLFLAALKFVFLKNLDLVSPQHYLTYYILIFIFSIAFARRVGVINYLEAIFIAITWFIGITVLDYFVLYNVLGITWFDIWQVWLGGGVMGAAIFFFHRKRHVEIRRQHGDNVLKAMFQTTFGSSKQAQGEKKH